MTRTVSILGSTGSIGRQTLDIIANQKNDFSVVALAAGRNADVLIEQARLYRPKFVAIADEGAYQAVKDALPGMKVAAGIDAVNEAARMDADITMAANCRMAGAGGRSMTLARTRRRVISGSTIGLAKRVPASTSAKIVP